MKKCIKPGLSDISKSTVQQGVSWKVEHHQTNGVGPMSEYPQDPTVSYCDILVRLNTSFNTSLSYPDISNALCSNYTGI